MKRNKILGALIFSIAFLTNCSKSDISTESLLNNNFKNQATAGDNKWDLLGHGYDATADYANYLSSRVLVIDIAKIKKSADSVYVINSTGVNQESIYETGKDATSYMKSISQKYNTNIKSDLLFFKGNLTANFNTKDSTTLNADYIYSSLNINIIQRNLKLYLTPQQIASKYLTSNFINDINTKTPKQIVETYGTHVLFNIILGGTAQLNYKAKSESTNRETAAKAGVAVNGGFKALGISISELKIEGDYAEYSKLVKTNYNQQLTIKCKGGDESKGVFTTIDLDKSNSPQLSISSWQSSISRENATLIDIGEKGLIPLYDLVNDANKKVALKTYIEQYFQSKQVTMLYQSSSVHQFYNLSKNVWRHEFNRNNPEVNTSDWQYKGVVFKAFQTQAPGTVPIYEFFANTTNDRTWGQSSIDDFNYWTLVGPKFYAYTSAGTGRFPIYRYYHHKSRKSHFLGKSSGIPAPQKEWTNEGIKFYAQ